ncbi:hypothetical protein QLX08_011289 [Tetragonisca angustula]|uniref:Secreted protein n=1 Tax=Tetragonisca angustula TaxID=166442 RepID=A0AAW0Z9W4_9HYME
MLKIPSRIFCLPVIAGSWNSSTANKFHLFLCVTSKAPRTLFIVERLSGNKSQLRHDTIASASVSKSRVNDFVPNMYISVITFSTRPFEHWRLRETPVNGISLARETTTMYEGKYGGNTVGRHNLCRLF